MGARPNGPPPPTPLPMSPLPGGAVELPAAPGGAGTVMEEMTGADALAVTLVTPYLHMRWASGTGRVVSLGWG
jgi:hypothetical protein